MLHVSWPQNGHFTPSNLNAYGLRLKPIFHCDAKFLALGVGVGQYPRRQNFALGIPTCWYLGANANPVICVLPDANLKFVFYPTRNPNASQWNIGCVGCQRKILALTMYISCFLC